MNTIWPFKLRLIAGVLMLTIIVSTGGYGSAAASPSVIPAVAPERPTNLGDPLTQQIIIKYRATANTTDRSGQINAVKLNALSTAAGETLTYKRAMSGDAHVLSLPARMSSASVEAIARRLAALPDVEYAEPDYVMRPTLELDWRAATTAGANNGGLTLWIDGVQQADLTGVDNDTRRIDQVRLGAASGVDTGTRGTYFFDAFESRRLTYIGP